MGMNIFRILGDLSHSASKFILIFSIHRNQSAEGVSLITQALYCLVFASRYLDIFLWNTIWNTVLKVFYIFSSLYILYLMLRVYARTREREKAWKLGAGCLVASIIGAPIMMLIFQTSFRWGWRELFWTFSIILESTCILPQLLLLRQSTIPTVIDSYYLLTLGSYRAFYILNWIWRELDITDRKPDAVSIIFGILQTAFYVDFAWVYYRRQRVKLRYGGIVDSDDLHKGWLLRTVFGYKAVANDEESAPLPGVAPRTGSNWGARGISVSADEVALDDDDDDDDENDDDQIYGGPEEGIVDESLKHPNIDSNSKMEDPDDLAQILDEDDGDIGKSMRGLDSSDQNRWQEETIRK
ncbi:hypothetical protein K3495_g10014 [Podosphaera aphanis]|nr:hypothetical protein K3495_g10014 [Podosphaera aphanis]